jgi:hypothetical protein
VTISALFHQIFRSPTLTRTALSRSMRSSTILILTLRALSQETIKNLVLAGVGRLIVMDDADVSERDFGAGLLFREGKGDVGKKVGVVGGRLGVVLRWPVVDGVHYYRESKQPYLKSSHSILSCQ